VFNSFILFIYSEYECTIVTFGQFFTYMTVFCTPFSVCVSYAFLTGGWGGMKGDSLYLL
jgi:hypothetical protein